MGIIFMSIKHASLFTLKNSVIHFLERTLGVSTCHNFGTPPPWPKNNVCNALLRD